MKHISENVMNVASLIALEYPSVVFCGSFGLVLNGAIVREVGDLDIFLPSNIFADDKFYPKNEIFSGGSDQFIVNFDEVLCRKYEINNVNIDSFRIENKSIDYNILSVDGIDFKIETPKAAIDAKLSYIENELPYLTLYKHIADLIECGLVDRYVLSKKIRNLSKRPMSMLFTSDALNSDYEDDLPF